MYTMEELIINGDSIVDFLEKFEEILQADVTIESDLSEFNYNISDIESERLTTKEVSELKQQKRPVRMDRKNGDEAVDCLVSPIIVEGNYMGNVTIWDVNENMMPLDYAVIEKASNLLSIELLKILIEQDIIINHESDFLREILFSSSFHQRYLEEFSGAFNIDLETSYFFILIEVDQDDLLGTSRVQDSSFHSFIKKDQENILVGRIEKYYSIIRSADH